jgi:hypothetical protein
VIRAFELAIQQLADPRLRGVIWQSLLLSLVLQLAGPDPFPGELWRGDLDLSREDRRHR